MIDKIFQTLFTSAEGPDLYDPRAGRQSELKLTMSVIQQTFIESFKPSSHYTFCQFNTKNSTFSLHNIAVLSTYYNKQR
jgi:hypothetical protein